MRHEICGTAWAPAPWSFLHLPAAGHNVSGRRTNINQRKPEMRVHHYENYRHQNQSSSNHDVPLVVRSILVARKLA